MFLIVMAFVIRSGSRDRRVSVWSAPADGDADAECRPCGPPLVLHESVTAVAFAPASASAGVATSHLLAVGCDDGAVAVYRWTPALAQPWHLVVDLDTRWDAVFLFLFIFPFFFGFYWVLLGFT